MRIATWNLDRPCNTTRTRHSVIMAKLWEVKADIWVLTETHSSVIPDMAYSASSLTAKDRTVAGESWVTIWSRYPITERFETCDPERTVAVMISQPGARELIVYGTVLPWRTDRRNGISWEHGKLYRDALDQQCEDWVCLTNSHRDADLCVAGDFNQALVKTRYYSMGANYCTMTKSLEDSKLTVLTAPDDPVKCIEPARASIDHICISMGSPRLPATSVVAWDFKTKEGVILSDHFGVVVELADS